MNFQQCPVCGDRRWKVYVNSVSGGWNCKTGECGAKGWLQGTGLAQLRRQLEAPKPVVWEQVDVPYTKPLGAHTGWVEEKYQLHNPDQLGLQEAKLTIPGTAHGVLIPYYNRQGHVIYWSIRRFFGEPKYMNKGGRHPLYVPMYATGTCFRSFDTLAVVEGAFDAMRVWRDTSMPVVALGGKSLPRYLKQNLLDMVGTKLIVSLDHDALADALKLRKQVGAHVDTEIVVLPKGKDPADCTAEELKEIFNAYT